MDATACRAISAASVEVRPGSGCGDAGNGRSYCRLYGRFHLCRGDAGFRLRNVGNGVVYDSPDLGAGGARADYRPDRHGLLHHRFGFGAGQARRRRFRDRRVYCRFHLGGGEAGLRRRRVGNLGAGYFLYFGAGQARIAVSAGNGQQ